MAAILFRFPMVFDKMAAILLGNTIGEPNRGYHWNSEHKRIPAPTVVQARVPILVH